MYILRVWHDVKEINVRFLFLCPVDSKPTGFFNDSIGLEGDGTLLELGLNLNSNKKPSKPDKFKIKPFKYFNLIIMLNI